MADPLVRALAPLQAIERRDESSGSTKERRAACAADEELASSSRASTLVRPAQFHGGKRELWTRLLEENFETLVKTARRLTGKGVPLSDLVQEGALALLTAIERVKTENLVELNASVPHIVEQRLRTLVRAARAPSTTSGGLLEDALAPDPQAVRLEAERIERADALLALLDSDEEQVLRLRFGIETELRPTLEETAKSLGMKRGRVSALEEKALTSLRRTVRRLRWSFPR